MCGRARCTLRADDIPRACHRTGPPVRSVDINRYRPYYNVSPGSNLPVIYREEGGDGQGYILQSMTWGLIPSFTKKIDKPDFYKMFNARSESLCQKGSFRRLLQKRRCLVAVEGFYEWKKDGSKKQPYYIHFKDGRPLVFAALYDSWLNAEGELIFTFTIVTTSSSSALQWLHDRMPVILSYKEATDTWLNASPVKLDVLRSYEDSDLGWYPVTPAMGKTSFDGPECIKEIQLKQEEKSTISKFFQRKETKREEPNSQQSSHEKAESPKSVKEGNKSKEKLSTCQILDIDSKPNEGESKCLLKRDHVEASLNADESEKVQQSPPRKKPTLASAGEKQQPTLFSYFGKK
ncbi:Abasic site processing protein HMCES [Euphorbia peplus]|nr:Abasic site processing protein HMCES [Euphorbia peplus]